MVHKHTQLSCSIKPHAPIYKNIMARGGQSLQNQFDMIQSTFNLVLNTFDTILSTILGFN